MREEWSDSFELRVVGDLQCMCVAPATTPRIAMTAAGLRHAPPRAREGVHGVLAHAGVLGSQPFSAVEEDNNGGADPTQFHVLMPSASGTYDVQVSTGYSCP